MSTNLPEDFFSWKSFQSLTQTAAIAWMLILITDAIFIMGIEDEYKQLVFIWVAGFSICFFLSCVRLYYKEVKEKGDYLLVVFNASLIFLYASGFSGFTAELGNWSKVKQTMSQETGSAESKTTLSYQFASFIPDIFANQTLFYPDIKKIEQNNFLVKENKNLLDKNSEAENKIKLISMGEDSHAKIIDSLIRTNAELQGRIATLTNMTSSGDDSGKLKERISRLEHENSVLRDSISQLKIRLMDCLEKNKQPSATGEIERLQRLISQHNELIDEFAKCLTNPDYAPYYTRFTTSSKAFQACNSTARNLLTQKIK